MPDEAPSPSRRGELVRKLALVFGLNVLQILIGVGVLAVSLERPATAVGIFFLFSLLGFIGLTQLVYVIPAIRFSSLFTRRCTQGART